MVIGRFISNADAESSERERERERGRKRERGQERVVEVREEMRARS